MRATLESAGDQVITVPDPRPADQIGATQTSPMLIEL